MKHEDNALQRCWALPIATDSEGERQDKERNKIPHVNRKANTFHVYLVGLGALRWVPQQIQYELRAEVLHTTYETFTQFNFNFV